MREKCNNEGELSYRSESVKGKYFALLLILVFVGTLSGYLASSYRCRVNTCGNSCYTTNNQNHVGILEVRAFHVQIVIVQQHQQRR